VAVEAGNMHFGAVGAGIGVSYHSVAVQFELVVVVAVCALEVLVRKIAVGVEMVAACYSAWVVKLGSLYLMLFFYFDLP
jgi:hypothetical protein